MLALFGVYGMLGIGLMLFSLRALDPVAPWKDGLVKFGFWATNVGLFVMVTLSLLPVGLMQTWASVEKGRSGWPKSSHPSASHRFESA